MTPPFPVAGTDGLLPTAYRLRHGQVAMPKGTPQAERLQCGLDLLAVLLCDGGEAWWREGYATSTYALGIVELGRN
jgi:hypothetical protein